MKVYLDTSPLKDANRDRGIGNYTKFLLANLRNIASEKFPLLVQASHELTSEIIEPSEHFDVVHYPFFDFFFPTLPSDISLPTVVTIHDVIPLLFPKQYPPGIKGTINYLRQRHRLKKISLVITDSQASKEGIREKLGISEEKIKVIHLAGNPEIKQPSPSQARRIANKFNLPSHYLVYVGDINYNKNLPTLLLALTQLPPSIHLCVVSRTWQNDSIPEGRQLKEIIKQNDLDERVRVLDIPSTQPEQLSAVLNQSLALVQPSLWEGFGLPVLEAFQAGTLVVATNAGSLPEISGKAAILVEPTLIGLVEGIETAKKLRGTARHEKIEAGLKQAQKFSWQETARQTYQAYQTAIDNWKTNI